MSKRANGEGSITFDKDRGGYVGRVTIGYDERGRPIRSKLRGKTRTEVVDRMKRARQALDGGLDVPNERLTVGQWLARWLDTLPGNVVLPELELSSVEHGPFAPEAFVPEAARHLGRTELPGD